MLTILAINRCHNPYKSTNTQKSPNLVTPFQLNITNLSARNTPFITPFLPPPPSKTDVCLWSEGLLEQTEQRKTTADAI